MRTFFAPLAAFICMAVHRSQKMVHASGGEHLIVCKTCDDKGHKDELKNIILTTFYFNRNLVTGLFLLPVLPIALISKKLTGRPGSFEHPPEHRCASFDYLAHA